MIVGESDTAVKLQFEGKRNQSGAQQQPELECLLQHTDFYAASVYLREKKNPNNPAAD